MRRIGLTKKIRPLSSVVMMVVLVISLMTSLTEGFMSLPVPVIHATSFHSSERERCSFVRMNMKESAKLNDECRNALDSEQQLSSLSLSTLTNRRSLLWKSLGSSIFLGSSMGGNIQSASAAVGTLPEFAQTNAILQGLTVKVADQSQQEAMIQFLDDSFDMVVLRKRIKDTVEETWMGFGPEELSIPNNFELGVSSFASYGGHASICIQYDSTTKSPLYRIGDNAPGDNIAYLQMGVPQYRISMMVKNGGNILDAYGIVNVISPAGLPIRGIVGISPDPIMFVAINCENVEKSRTFYQQLGFVEQKYPYCRPGEGTGQFEPPQPAKSVYLAPSPNSMGLLLLQKKDKKKPATVNPIVDSLRIVYTPAGGGGSVDGDSSLSFVDPSGVKVALQSADTFIKEERITR